MKRMLSETSTSNLSSHSLQIARKASLIDLEKKKKRANNNMDIPLENCFMDQFELTLSPDRQDKLEHSFNEIYKGKMPNRSELKALSLKLGTSQARIRRWFYDRIVKEEQSQKFQGESETFHSMAECDPVLISLHEDIKSNWFEINTISLFL
jgi:hypothetical protein